VQADISLADVNHQKTPKKYISIQATVVIVFAGKIK
jgi:hypothetical protein